MPAQVPRTGANLFHMLRRNDLSSFVRPRGLFPRCLKPRRDVCCIHSEPAPCGREKESELCAQSGCRILAKSV